MADKECASIGWKLTCPKDFLQSVICKVLWNNYDTLQKILWSGLFPQLLAHFWLGITVGTFIQSGGALGVFPVRSHFRAFIMIYLGIIGKIRFAQYRKRQHWWIQAEIITLTGIIRGNNNRNMATLEE